ncbi:MAG TPA: hypothetical protein VIK27_08035 [Candidatus Aquilonibacter sp.]
MHATLTYYLYIYTNEPTRVGAKDTLKLTVNGTTEQSFSNLNQTGGNYVEETVNLSSFAGSTSTLLWTSKQAGSRATDFFIDSTALTLSGGSSTPTPSPTATPTTSPTATPSSGCNGAAPDNGPLTNSNGTLATGVAKPFDFPVQHGCNGAGYTAAIVIDDPVDTSYVASHLSSSFGGCESSDTSFESATNAIAEQGAAEGVEFSASAGDTGSDECGTNDNAKGVSAPAGDPYFTSIGGVNFTQSNAGVLESVTAGDASCGNSSGTCYGGGGVSTVVALPSRQTGIAGMITSGRNQPDISLPFDYGGRLHGRRVCRILGNVVVLAGIGGIVHRSRPAPRQQARLAQSHAVQPVLVEGIQHVLHALHLGQ